MYHHCKTGSNQTCPKSLAAESRLDLNAGTRQRNRHTYVQPSCSTRKPLPYPSSSTTTLHTCGVHMRLKAAPLRPKRPERPIRCRYVSKAGVRSSRSTGTSKFITSVTWQARRKSEYPEVQKKLLTNSVPPQTSQEIHPVGGDAEDICISEILVKTRTWLTSKPRESTSVEMSILVVPSRNSCTTRSRSMCSMSPVMDVHL